MKPAEILDLDKRELEFAYAVVLNTSLPHRNAAWGRLVFKLQTHLHEGTSAQKKRAALILSEMMHATWDTDPEKTAIENITRSNTRE